LLGRAVLEVRARRSLTPVPGPAPPSRAGVECTERKNARRRESQAQMSVDYGKHYSRASAGHAKRCEEPRDDPSGLGEGLSVDDHNLDRYVRRPPSR